MSSIYYEKATSLLRQGLEEFSEKQISEELKKEYNIYASPKKMSRAGLIEKLMDAYKENGVVVALAEDLKEQEDELYENRQSKKKMLLMIDVQATTTMNFCFCGVPISVQAGEICKVPLAVWNKLASCSAIDKTYVSGVPVNTEVTQI